MATKAITTKLTDKETRYNRRVKSVELAIKSQVSKNGALISTIMKAAKDIYDYINSDE